jgi:uncharacterized membrane protein YccC
MSALPLLRWTNRLPAHVVNGITFAIGIGAVELLFGSIADADAAQLAVSGALCAGLADQPETPARSWRRVLAAGAFGCTTALLICALSTYPLAIGAGIVLVVLGATMIFVWGPAAGPVSFAAVLSMVFTMALPPGQEPLRVAGWNSMGALVYLCWSLAVNVALQPRYRRLALAAALDATARLLRTRSRLLEGTAQGGAESGLLRDWIRDEAALAERLQAARDLLFVAPDTLRARRATATLLRAIELRDILLASRLDLDLLGEDDAARRVRTGLARQLRQVADRLDTAQRVLLDADPMPAPAQEPGTLASVFEDVSFPNDDPRARLLPALVNRVHRLREDGIAIDALVRGGQENLPLSPGELRHFVTPEGWPLGALRGHVSMESPVLRHALRASLALAAAYYVALALPWASHPQWLVLSVAVVLRGNLDQTLSRRNARVLGTALGCLLVMLVARVPSSTALTLVFIGAAGLAHGFAVERYVVTAVAATVMALLQAHFVNPAAGIPIAERLADTVLGAMLAWGFSFVLPSWERHGLPRSIARALQALHDYAQQALRKDAGSALAQRLARRRAYDALATVAAALQRCAAEPARVRPPVRELTMLLDHAQRLMAHLSMVRLTLARTSAELDRPEAAAALQAADAALNAALTSSAPADPAPVEAPGLELLPAEPPAQSILPWLLRRLQVTVHDGNEVARAARRVLNGLDGWAAAKR